MKFKGLGKISNLEMQTVSLLLKNWHNTTSKDVEKKYYF